MMPQKIHQYIILKLFKKVITNSTVRKEALKCIIKVANRDLNNKSKKGLTNMNQSPIEKI
jgi:hypothetical protein